LADQNFRVKRGLEVGIGATVLTALPGGSVGIGTTNPTEEIHLWTSQNEGTVIRVDNPNTGTVANASVRLFSDTATVTHLAHGSGRVESRFGTVLARFGEISLSSGNGLLVGTQNASTLIFGTNDTETLRIDSSQRVGIGTTNPTSKLTVIGDTLVTGVSTIVANRSTEAFRITQTGTGNALVVEDETNPDSTPFVITGIGSVGIGITNPVTPLHISDGNGGISTALYISDFLTISAQNSAPGFNIIAAGSAATHRGVFKATRSRGTLSSPTVPLTDDNTFSLLGAIYDGSTGRSTAAINMDVDGDVGLGTAPQRITFWTGTGSTRLERARIQSTGEVLIGSATSTGTASQTLQVTGGAYITGVTTSTDFDSLSDINLKTNISQIADPLEKVMQIRGVTFNWKEDNRNSAGVIAQEIEKILPELVHGEETKTVNYNGLIGLLIECVKKQQEEIDELKKKVN
jgi:hypothetical protein